MNWISTLSSLRIVLLIVFVLTSLGQRLNWFESIELMTAETLTMIRYLLILIYGVIYIIELKISLKHKNNEIKELKVKLNRNEN